MVLHQLAFDYWPVLLLVGIRPFLAVVTALAFSVLRTAVDHHTPHDLPAPAGPWLRARVLHQGLQRQIAVLTTPEPGSVDAYFPGSRFIQLTPETWLRRDAVGWATAAHELGHALNYRRSWWVHNALVGARWGARATMSMATGFLLVAILVGSRLLLSIAHGLLFIAVAAALLVVLDELWASWIGFRLLRRDARVDSLSLDGATVTMGAAFLSYASNAVAQVALLVAFPSISALVQRSPVVTGDAPSLSGLLGAVVLVLGVALGIRGMAEFYRVVVPPRYDTTAEAEVAMHLRGLLDLGWALPLVVVLALVWNQELGPQFALAYALATLPGIRALHKLVSPLLPFVLLPFVWFIGPLVRWAIGPPRAPGPLPEHAAKGVIDRLRRELSFGQVAVRQAQLEMVNDPPLYLRLSGLVRVAYLPLVALLLWEML